MSEINAYRANEELTAAWREFIKDRDRHVETVVKPFTEAHPNNEPMVDRWHNIIGFADGATDQPPPRGLSRAQTRHHLIPVRGKSGDEWREWMAKLNLPCTSRQLLRRFDLSDQLFTGTDGQTYLGRPDAVDFGADGVFVYMAYQLDVVPDCLAPVKLSEFYAARERAQERRESAVSL